MKTTQEVIDVKYILKVLNNNGINEKYLLDNDNQIEGGTEEWMDVVSEISGMDAYNMDVFPDEIEDKIMKFIYIMDKEMGIELF